MLRFLVALVYAVGIIAGPADAASRAVMGNVPVAGISAPSTSAALPTGLSSAPTALYGTKRLRVAYAGSSAVATRVSDSGTCTATFDARGDIDLAALRTCAGGPLTPGVLQVTTINDQSGNAFNMACTGSVWLISERDAYGTLFPDRAVIALASQKYAFTGIGTAQAQCTFPSGVTASATSYSDFLVTAPMVSYQNNALYLRGSVTGTTRNNLFTDKSSGLQVGSVYGAAFGGRQLPVSMVPRANQQVFNVNSRTNGKTVWVEDLSASLGVEDTQTLTGGGIGPTGAGATYFSNQDLSAVALYPGLTDPEATTVRGILSAAWSTAKKRNRLIIADSSTPEGVGSVNNRSYPRLVQGRLDRPIDVYAMGASGNTLVNARDTFLAKIAPLLASGVNNIYLPDSGSNDFLNYTSGTASNDANTTYQVYKTLSASAIAAGAKVIAATTRLRSDYSAYQQQVLAAYGAQMRAGQSDLGYAGLFDIATAPEFATPDATYFRAETGGAFIHPNDAGELVNARVLTPRVQEMLQ